MHLALRTFHNEATERLHNEVQAVQTASDEVITKLQQDLDAANKRIAMLEKQLKESIEIADKSRANEEIAVGMVATVESKSLLHGVKNKNKKKTCGPVILRLQLTSRAFHRYA